MTILQSLTFDTYTEGASISAPPSPWSLVSAGAPPIATSAAAVHGTMGCRWSTGASDCRIQYDTGAPLNAVRIFEFYFKIPTWPTADQFLAGILSVSGSFQAHMYLYAGDHSVRVRDDQAATFVGASNGSLALNTVYRVEWQIDPIGKTQTTRFYQGDNATPDRTSSGATYTSTTGQAFAFGPVQGGVADYDTVRIADNWIGPYVPPQWQLHQFRYDGSVWR